MNLDERVIQSADPADLPTIIGELHRLSALALSRIITTPTLVTTQSETEPQLLTVPEAAALVRLSPVALRRSAKFRSARRKLGERSLRFDRAALLRIAGRAA
jgi:hypothetical protein